MMNHVHLILVSRSEEALGRVLRDSHRTYAMHFNRRVAETGHLWQAPYYSCVLDDVHLWTATRYVERKPVRAGLVKRAEEYPWPSANAHDTSAHLAILADDFPPPGVTDDWST